MLTQPKVSICIPTYNQREEFLRAAVASALAQQHESLEVIVSDNHSTNETPQLLAQFADPRLVVVKPPRHLSMPENFAFAGAQAGGEFLSFLSSDDLLHPEWCTHLVPLLANHPSIAFAYCNISWIDENGNVTSAVRSSHPSFIRNGRAELQRLVKSTRTWIIGGLIRRSAYQAGGGINTSLSITFDWYLGMSLLAVGDVAYHDDILASVRIWTNQERRLRLAVQVDDIRRFYEAVASSNLINCIDDPARTISRARKRYALFVSAALPQHQISGAELKELSAKTLLLDHSRSTRFMLWLLRTPLAPLVGKTGTLMDSVRRSAASLLYRWRMRK